LRKKAIEYIHEIAKSTTALSQKLQKMEMEELEEV